MNPTDIIHESWKPLKSKLYQEPFITLNEKVLSNISYQPKKQDIFKVFEMPVNDIKVVVLGQDPYPKPGDAIGKAFAVSENTKVPASLRVIAKEVIREFMKPYNENNIDETYQLLAVNDNKWKTLKHWTNQGVFLLNTALTVETGNAGSHLNYWSDFTKSVIQYISTVNPCIWLLWGKKAQNFAVHIRGKQINVNKYNDETINDIPNSNEFNYILKAPHPASELYSGGNSGFYGCKHFLHTNKILKHQSKKTIDW